MNKKVLRTVIGVMVVAVLISGGLWQYSIRPRTVTVTFTAPAPMTIAIYRGGSVDEHGHAHEPVGDSVTTINSSGEIKLRPGNYIAVSRDSEDYTEYKESFTVDEGAEIIVDPTLTPEALERALLPERDPIVQAVTSQVDGYNSNQFTTIQPRLHKTGQWASAVIVSNVTEDYFHVVLEKEEGSWVVRTTPSIIVSAPLYPDIPRDILVEINKSQYQSTEYRAF